MDTDTSMEATAAAYHSEPIEPAARTPPVFFRVLPAFRYQYWYCHSCRGSNPDDDYQYR